MFELIARLVIVEQKDDTEHDADDEEYVERWRQNRLRRDEIKREEEECEFEDDFEDSHIS